MMLRSLSYGYCPDFACKLLERFYDKAAAQYLREKAKAMDENRLASFVNRFVSCYKPGEKENLYLVKATLFGKPEIAVNGLEVERQ
ncbi:MAG: hypothetical protein ACOX3R_13085 [Desulfitobacteriia bacterium]|jgi:hypothetical protein